MRRSLRQFAEQQVQPRRGEGSALGRSDVGRDDDRLRALQSARYLSVGLAPSFPTPQLPTPGLLLQRRLAADPERAPFHEPESLVLAHRQSLPIDRTI